MKKQGGLYDKSPKMERGEGDKMEVKKPEKKEEAGNPDGLPPHERHMAELKDMQDRHLKEYKDMHTRHEKDQGATGGSTDGAPIKDIEKGAKPA